MSLPRPTLAMRLHPAPPWPRWRPKRHPQSISSSSRKRSENTMPYSISSSHKMRSCPATRSAKSWWDQSCPCPCWGRSGTCPTLIEMDSWTAMSSPWPCTWSSEPFRAMQSPTNFQTSCRRARCRSLSRQCQISTEHPRYETDRIASFTYSNFAFPSFFHSLPRQPPPRRSRPCPG